MSISLALFALAFKYFFTENKLARIFSKIGTIFLIFDGIALIVVAFTPYDISDIFGAVHYISGLIGGLAGLIGGILYTIVIFHNEEYPNRYAFTYMVMLVAGVLTTVVLILFAVPYSMVTTTEELIMHTGAQKITTYLWCVVNLIIRYGARKQIKS